MTRALRAGAVTVFLVGIFLSIMTGGRALAGDIVSNPGFEQSEWGFPRPWWAEDEGRNWSYENQGYHSGSKSFKVTYTALNDPRNLAGQGISITQNKLYRIGAWIKTQDVTGGGASIFIEWYSSNNTWLGGEWGFPRVTGTTDWQFISLPSVPTPTGTTKATIYLGWAGGSPASSNAWTGTAWYDDVVVEECTNSSLTSFIRRPNYAGKILPDSPSPEIEVVATLSGVTLSKVKIAATLKNNNGDTIAQKNLDSISSNNVTINLDLPDDAPAGIYDLDMVLSNKSDCGLLAQNCCSFDKLSHERFSAITSYIDSHNRFILNGEPFFPIGLYMGDDYRWDYSQVDEVADSPFDTVMNYGINVGNPGQITSYLDHLHSKNLNLIYSLKDFIGHGQTDIDTIIQKVNAYKNHPAIISWYMNDESGLEYLPELEAHYQKVRELDENHPVWSVHYQKDVLVGEAHTTDILGVDPYPIPTRPITLVSDMSDWAKEAGRGGYRPLWLVPQIFDQGNYDRHPNRLPTPEEMRAMTYLATNHGAKGLIYYSYFDIRFKSYYETHWAAIKKIASEIKSLRPVFLSTEMPDVNGLTCSNSSIDYKLMKGENTYYLFAVNTIQENVLAVSFQNNLTCKPSIINVLFENGRQIPVSNGNFTDNFLPYEVHVYEFETPTLIELGQFKATPFFMLTGGQVIVTWSTLSEKKTAGFNLWRSDEEKGEYTRINSCIIEAKGGATLGAHYSYTDDTASYTRTGVTWHYKLEDIDTQGKSTFHGPVSADPLYFQAVRGYNPLLDRLGAYAAEPARLSPCYWLSHPFWWLYVR